MESLVTALKNPRTQLRFLLFCIVVVWINSVHADVVNIDTPWLVCTNPILSGGQLDAWGAIWTDLSFSTRQILGAEFLPLRDVSVWLDFAIFGDQWGGHHLTNLILYTLACILFWAVLRQFLSPERAFLASLFFALHPTHVESVAWLASRKDVLSLAFVMAATLAFLKNKSIWLVTILSLAAYWSKNTAISLAPILLSASILLNKESIRNTRWWLKWIPIAGVFGLGLAITLNVGEQMAMFAPQRADNALGTLSITAQVWFQYAGMLIWPTKLSLLYVEPVTQPLSNPEVLLGMALIMACLTAPFLIWRRKPIVAFGLIWIGVSLLPVSQISPIQNLMADRYLLLPSAGLAITLGALWPNRLKIAPPIYVAALGILTLVRLPTWHSSEDLWTDVTQKQPLEPRGWAALSGVHQANGNMAEARRITERGIGFVNAPVLHQSLGLIALNEGDLITAKIELTHAWTQDQQLRKSGNNLALVYHQMEDFKTAVQIAEDLTFNHPLYATGWNTKGAILLDMGELEAAKRDFEKALERDPFLISAIANLGNVAYQEDDHELARKRWMEVLMINPEHTHSRNGIQHLDSLEQP